MFGGAELHCKQFAETLASLGHEVSILTTCSESSTSSWSKDHFKPGITKLNQLQVFRFPLRMRNEVEYEAAMDFTRIYAPSVHPQFLRRKSPLTPEQEEVVVRENIQSLELLQFLKKTENYFDYFLFIPYLYGVVLSGVSIVPEKAILIPCLHDEMFAYLHAVENIFSQSKYILFNSRGEQEVAKKIMRNLDFQRSIVLGEGLELHSSEFSESELESLKKKLQEQQPTLPKRNEDNKLGSQKTVLQLLERKNPNLLFVGRVQDGKGVPELLEYFLKLKTIEFSKLQELFLENPALQLSQSNQTTKEKNLKELRNKIEALDVKKFLQNLELRLAGKNSLTKQIHHDSISYIDSISEDEKKLLLHCATCIANLSPNESYSRLIYEGWFAGKPVLVRKDCLATALALEDSGNLGFGVGNFSDFVFAIFELALGSFTEEKSQMAKKFADQTANWEQTAKKFLDFLAVKERT